jgi:hypothetical protein
MSDSSKTDLKLFINPPAKTRLKNYTIEEQGKLKIFFNSRADDVHLTPISYTKNPWQAEEYSAGRDTFILWMNDTAIDSLKIVMLQNEQPFDTASFILKTKLPGKGTKAKSFLFNSNALSGTLDAGKDLLMVFTHPVSTVDESKIIFKKDSIQASGISYSFSDSIKRNFVVKYKWKENEDYELTFLPGAFKDIFNVTNDTSKISFRLKPATEFGSVLLKLKTDDKSPNYIIQVVSEKDDLIREKIIDSSGDLNFEFLNPGSYRLKIIFDKNKNKRWDAGNYLQKIQPEKVIYYKENITIRANWDLEQEWDLKK